LRRDDRRQELDEIRTGVPGRRLAHDPAGARVEGRIQREGAVPVLFEAVASGP